MGLLPEIERVWISIDHNLFLWNYLAGFVSVALASSFVSNTRPTAKS